MFEWTTTTLGSQGTVCAGGRYDGLVEQLGGKPVPAVGFAMGIERLVLMLDTLSLVPASALDGLDAYLLPMSEASEPAALLLAERLRDALPTLGLQLHCGGGSFKSRIKKADKSGARLALLIGEDELARGSVERDHARFVDDDALPRFVDEGVRGAEVDREVAGRVSQALEHAAEYFKLGWTFAARPRGRHLDAAAVFTRAAS